MENISECQIPGCGRPLGQDSKNLEWPICPDHRSCESCHRAVTRPEADYCIIQGIAIRHSRCLVLSDYQTDSLDAETALLNLCRLLIKPDLSLSPATQESLAATRTDDLIINYTLEEQYYVMRTMQAIAARISLLISKNKGALKLELDEKVKRKAEEVETFRKSGNLTKADKNKISADSKQVRVAGDKRNKAINALMKAGLSAEVAASIFDKNKET